MSQNSDSYTVNQLLKKLKTLFAERDWEKFHAPKNLAMNLMVETSELAEFFTWISEEQSRDIPLNVKSKVAEEVGDVFINLMYLCDKLGIDLFKSTFDKIEKIDKKYPVEQFKGRDTKFSVVTE